jgi:hypothetical protein
MQGELHPSRNQCVVGLDFLLLAQISDSAYLDFVLAEKKTNRGFRVVVSGLPGDVLSDLVRHLYDRLSVEVIPAVLREHGNNHQCLAVARLVACLCLSLYALRGRDNY